MPFQKGFVPNPLGRRVGTINKATLRAQQGLANAIDVLRAPDRQSPIQVMIDAARFLATVGAAISRHGTPTNADSAVVTAHIANLAVTDPKRFDRMVDVIYKGAVIAGMCAEYAYPKLARIETVGDAPSAKVENKIMFVMNTGDPEKVKWGEDDDDNGTTVKMTVTSDPDSRNGRTGFEQELSPDDE